MRRVAQSLLIGMFLAGIAVPGLQGLWLDYRTTLEAENRRAFEPPTLTRKTWKWFPQHFELYFNDHIGFRDFFVQSFRTTKLKVFQVTPSSLIIIGQDGWLFHSFPGIHDDGHSVESQQHIAKWKHVLEQRHAWLAERGIHCITTIAPDKQTIYPEHLPLRHQRGIASFTPHDALMESGVNVVDLRPTLRAGKSSENVYHIADTHWTSAGVMLSHHRLIEAAQQWYPDWHGSPLESYSMQIEAYPMDMKMMLGLPPAERMGEHRLHRLKQLPLMDRKPLANPEQIVGWQRQIDAEIYDNPSSKGPHVMLVCDSFGCELREHLAPLCRRLVIAPSSVLPHAIIEREKPDLVIVEMAERRLGRFP